MQLIDDQALNYLTDGYDEVVSTTSCDNRVDDSTYIVGLVFIVRVLVKKLLDDIRKVRWQCFPNLRTSVLTRYIATYLHEPIDRNMVPIGDVPLGLLDQF